MSDFLFAIPGLMDMQTPISDSLPAMVKLEPHSISNSLWVGMPDIGPVREDGVLMPFPAASAVIEFAPTPDGKYPLFVMSTTPDSGQGVINITGNPANWLFSIPKQPIQLPVGMWYWVAKVTDTSQNTTRVSNGSLLITS